MFKKIKKTLLILILAFISCEDNETNFIENNDLKLISKTITDQNGVITNEFFYSYDDSEKLVEILNPKKTSQFHVDSLKTKISYSGELIIKISEETLAGWIDAETTFNYYNHLKLKSSIRSYGDATELDSLFNNYTWNTNQITIEETFKIISGETIIKETTESNTYELDNQSYIISNQMTYDNKNNPSILIYPENIFIYFRETPNNITADKNYTYKYEYNMYDYPVKKLKYLNDKLIQETIFKYNK